MEKSVTFLELIEDKKILIPQIQRDYAQGRLGEKTSEVRYNFLHALKDALGKDNHKPLILDFIYGTEEDNCFKPLDGQQRLTTLFLLHWFLCPKDELFILQKNEDNNDIYSRFTYETRVSSKDFFNEIAKISYFDLKRKLDDRKTKLNEKILDKKITLSDIIIDDPWFLWEWKKDPTIKGALIVLNDLEFMFEDHLSEERLNFWKRLNSGNISFNLLHLEEFDLSDELYVKMNARGKELSQFDFFKSSLEEQMIKNEVNEDIKNEWKKNIDSTWIDLFWNKSISQEEIEHDEFDKQNENVVNTEIYYFTFLKKLIILYLLENESYFNGLDWDENALKSKLPFDYEKDTAISKIKEFAVKNNLSELFPFLYKTDFFDDSFFNFIIDTFKSLIYKENTLRNDASQLIKGVYFENDKDTLLEVVISNDKNEYEDLLQFYSLLFFTRYNPAKKIKDDIELQVELNSWMRVIRNLTTLSNVFIDDFNDFESSLFAFKNWAIDIYKDKSFNSITSYINSNPKKRPKGRNVSLQLREEEHKARLFLKDQTWKDLIREIEEHKYFLGQINFLLQWSNDSLDEFKKYNHAVKKIFDENGLKSYLSKDGEHLFRNCLLVNDNYLNQSCFINNINKNRDRSWKNYLRYKEKHYNIKKIIDGWSKSKIKSFNDFCINEIKTKKNNVVDWRRCFLEFPEIYDICSKDKIYYFNNDTTKIFLLETSLKWNGLNRHTELFTYYWSLLLNNFGGWSSVYFNSQEDCPLCVKFSKENYDIICQFVLSDNSSKYSLRINFNPEESVYKKEDESWYRYFNTEESKEVEKELRKLMA